VVGAGDPVVGVAGDGFDVCVFEDFFGEFEDGGVVFFGVEVLGEDECCGGEMLGYFVGFLGVLHCLAIEFGESFDVYALESRVEEPHCQENIGGSTVRFLRQLKNLWWGVLVPAHVPRLRGRRISF